MMKFSQRGFNAAMRSGLFAQRLAFDFGSIRQFKLPDLGEKIKEAVVQKWLVKEGEEVEEFQNLADVSTDKLFTQIPSTEKGKIHKLYVKEGDPCQVGSVLLELEVEDEAPAANAKQPATATITSNTQDCPLAGDKQEARSTSPGGKVLSTPVVREYAKQKGIDINLVVGTGAEGRVTKQDVDNFKPGQQTQKPHSPRIEIGVDMYQDMLATPAVRSFATDNRVDISQVKGSGKHGRILKEDILDFKDKPQNRTTEASSKQQPQTAAPPAGVRVVKMNPIMQGMVKSMNHAATVPHFYLKDEFDITRLTELRDKLNTGKTGTEKIALFSFIAKAFSAALKEFPSLNSKYSDDKPFEYQVYEDHNISVAIDTPNGLMAPNLKGVQNKSIRQIQNDLRDLRVLAEQARLGPNELFGGTIALSNIGSIGGTYAGPLNLPNQVCIVAIGRTREVPGFVSPVKVDGKTLYDVQMRKVINVSFGCDHRVLDGATVTRFCNRWKEILEEPERLLLELK